MTDKEVLAIALSFLYTAVATTVGTPMLLGCIIMERADSNLSAGMAALYIICAGVICIGCLMGSVVCLVVGEISDEVRKILLKTQSDTDICLLE